MFEELVVQIKHQYGKFLYFHNAYNDSKEPMYGMKQNCRGFNESETIVRFIRKGKGYQIQHQNGKVLNFDHAYTKSKEPVFGMRNGFFQDETIVDIIPKNDGYQIQHQYGKYLNFDNAYTQNKERVYGMTQGFFQDETIVYLIPKNYKFYMQIVDFLYDTSEVHDAQLYGQIQNFSLIHKTFHNNSKTDQKFSINESVTVNNTTTFQHTTAKVTKWLKEVSVAVSIKTEGKISLPLVTKGRVEAEKSVGFKHAWEGESTKQFSKTTSHSVEQTISVTDEITVSPRSTMIYKYSKTQLTGIAIPYQAVMKVKCEMGGSDVSDEALKFILDYSDCPSGKMKSENGHGVYSIPITGEIKLDVALNFSTYCDQFEQKRTC